MILYPDIPRSKGVENGLKRAAQLVQATYTPIRTLPTSLPVIYEDLSRMYPDTHLPAYFPITGFQYSSVRRTETYISYNISFETFFSAVSNPDSVIYTRPIRNTGSNVHNYYGIVCSCFVSWVLDLPYRTPCVRLPLVPGMKKVDSSDLRNLALLDVVLNVQKHVAIITGIERDAEGQVGAITVSEAVMPNCRCTRMKPEDFRNHWLCNGYEIYRYDKLDEITYTPSPFIPLPGDPAMPEPVINKTLMPDYGNKANYRLNEEPVTISVFDPAVSKVIVKRKGGRGREYAVSDGHVTIRPRKAGFYEVIPVLDGQGGPSVSFCVTEFNFTPDKASYRPGDPITVAYENTAGDTVVAWQFNRKSSDRGCGGSFTGDLPPKGTLTLKVPSVDDEIELYLMARNAYGIYTSRRVTIPVEK
ncbi:MAG: hypothetical protein IKY02_03110 [Lachnospiraceae bacterium]|nr:hypothetical protein [Lachnospiraceae bacterium]